jgi:hypothetical protein
MVGCYMVRKLEDAFQPVRSKTLSLPIMTFGNTEGDYHTWHWPKIRKHFNLNRPQKQSVSVRQLCNEVIHSRVFTPCYDATRLRGVFVVSDYNQSKRVLLIDLEGLARLFERVARSNKFYLRVGRVERMVRWNNYQFPG